jgi:hypothetical protein
MKFMWAMIRSVSKFCLLTVNLSRNVPHQSLTEASLECQLITPRVDSISNELLVTYIKMLHSLNLVSVEIKSESLRYAVHS